MYSSQTTSYFTGKPRPRPGLVIKADITTRIKLVRSSHILSVWNKKILTGTIILLELTRSAYCDDHILYTTNEFRIGSLMLIAHTYFVSWDWKKCPNMSWETVFFSFMENLYSVHTYTKYKRMKSHHSDVIPLE